MAREAAFQLLKMKSDGNHYNAFFDSIVQPITGALCAPESAYSASGAPVAGWPLCALRALCEFFHILT